VFRKDASQKVHESRFGKTTRRRLRAGRENVGIDDRTPYRTGVHAQGGLGLDAIILGIDGTGVISKSDYKREMATSFVRYIVNRSPARLKKYIQGPWYEGFDMGLIVDAGYTFINLSVAAQPKCKIYLTGYSRGGAGVIGVAQRLSEKGVNVDGIVLFDAVDRSLAVNSSEIPRNVLRLVHARRHPQANSRGTFGSSGTIWHAPTRTNQAFFWGTHGALGGVPNLAPQGAKSTDLITEYLEPTPSNISYAQDKRCATEVWAWASPHVNRLGFFGGKVDQTSNA